jgi:hypothetical protein
MLEVSESQYRKELTVGCARKNQNNFYKFMKRESLVNSLTPYSSCENVSGHYINCI